MHDEYNYILQLAHDRYFAGIERLVEPIHAQVRTLLISNSYTDILNLEEKSAQFQRELVFELHRAEEILAWLRLDSEMRLDGTTYPDMAENAHSPRPH